MPKGIYDHYKIRGKMPKNRVAGWNKNLPLSEEWKRKIVETRKKNDSYIISEVTKEKISQALKGKKHPWVKGWPLKISAKSAATLIANQLADKKKD